tara:strand:- start:735 stop:920 length:186 start_codon:yes stop_codon:yes gene_type:complete
MVCAALTGKQVKQRMVLTESSPEQKKLTPIVRALPVLKNVRTRPALIRYPEKSGNVKVKGQ